MNKVSEFVFETFLRLTSKTYPFGYEDDLIDQMKHTGIFPDGLSKDSHGNYFYNIGETRTIFASHLDTVSKDYVGVTHVFDGDIIKTDGKTTLGADDKAGVTIMLWMIKNKIPGTYYFFIGEEVGCVGSGLVSKHENFKGKYDRIISFDRRGTGSIITYQSSTRCCSDAFANKLCSELNKSGLSYSKDTGGVYTDSAEFTGIIPECTNVSVGYYSEHTTGERQDIKHLVALADACTKVDWHNLPVERNPAVKEYKSYNSNYKRRNYHNSTWNYDDDGEYATQGTYPSNYSRKKTRRGDNKKKDKNLNLSGKSYYDKGDGSLVDFTREFNKNYECVNGIYLPTDKIDTTDKYTWLVDKFVSDTFTWSELQILKDQYLDMSSTFDETMYEYLKGKVVDL
jgi:hypothetical protein